MREREGVNGEREGMSGARECERRMGVSAARMRVGRESEAKVG